MRFDVGDRVLCAMGGGEWVAGQVVALDYREEYWPKGSIAPYQVHLDTGGLVFAPEDDDSVVQKETEQTKHLAMSTAERYEPMRVHPALFDPGIKEEWLDPRFSELMKRFRNYSSEQPVEIFCADLEQVDLGFRVESEEVYSFPVFSQLFIDMFNAELKSFYESGLPARRPNSMNNYGIIVNEIGMRGMITAFQQQHLLPMSQVLFPDMGYRFDSHHSFIVRYEKGEDRGLDMHTDDSDVTFNVCLGDVFTGATLAFCGMIATRQHRKLKHVYQHEIGRGVIHLGTRRHGADDIDSGRRINLIVWSHNEEWRATHPAGRRNNSSGEEYEAEDSPPDPICLSLSHDRDFTAYREIPEWRKGSIHQGGSAGGGSKPWCPPRHAEYPGFPLSGSPTKF